MAVKLWGAHVAECTNRFNTQGRMITQRPEFYIALTTMILGAQFFIAGFLGEILIRHNNNIKRYNITNTTYG